MFRLRFFIKLSYNGKAYHGWQRQPNAITVQEVLEESMCALLQDTVVLMGAGRTDTGVHAAEMFAHFDINQKIPEQFLFRLNSFLPEDIAVHDIFEVEADNHARFNALSRTYKYRVSIKKNVFNTNSAFAFYRPLDFEKMNAACDVLFQYSNFQCFSKSKTDVKTYNCTIEKAYWIKSESELVFHIKANRFLRNMVRAIVGTMIQIGLGTISEEDLHNIINSKSRSEAGFSVPAHGLYLIGVEYPESIVGKKRNEN